MLNSKFLQKINCSNFPKSRSRSIYRGNQSHTASMNLKIQCDLSPQTLRQPKQSQRTYKQALKQNKSQKMRDSLRIVETNFSGKKTQRQDIGQKSSKNILLPTRQLETQRVLKQTTNIISRKQSSIRQQRTTMATITLTSNKKQPKSNDKQQVAITQQQLKQILITMQKLEKQNKMLKKQISLYLQNPKNTVSKALL